MKKYILAYVAALGLVLGAFQNCSKANFSSNASSNTDGGATAAGGVDPNAPGNPNLPGTPDPGTPVIPPSQPSLLVAADPPTVNKGSSTTITAIVNDVDEVSYACTPSSGGPVVASGTLPSALALSLPVTQDLNCVFSGTGTKLDQPIRAALSIAVNCGAQVKDADGVCRDFSCKSVVTLNPNALDIPARTIDGVCYATKVISGVESGGASSLTAAHDASVWARSHDAATSGTTQHPYLMGNLQMQFNMRGARVVKLAGGPSATAPIVVDNFILTGIFPAGTTPDLAKAYRVRGTSDASILNNGSDTGAILFNSTPLAVESFASGGASSIAPIDISAFATPNVTQQLDVRALDCGGSRALSDIYVLFQ